MFYSVFVLGKKGPLARVWLAAHWDKKITKAQILETNIVESVDSILQPKIKLSLRTSSHLLLGIVRIYARKALYLLQDCQDAAFKIKSAFRPGVVDLPDGKTEAAISAITLPEMFDFINDFDLIAEPQLQIDAPTTTANIRNITLVEDISSIHVDDPLGVNEVCDWSEIGSIGTGSIQIKDTGDSSLINDSGISFKHPDMIDAPAIDDGFGGQIGVGIVGLEEEDVFGMTVPSQEEVRDGTQNNLENGHQLLEDENRPNSRMSVTSNMSYPESPAHSAGPPSIGSFDADPDDMFNNIDNGPVDNQSIITESDLNMPRSTNDQPLGTLSQNTMVLEPIDSQQGGIERRRKRRKKIGMVIDEVKTLSGEEMKSQLSDTSDIVANLDLAPPNKMLMNWKKTGLSDKLFTLPERSITAKVLFQYYSRNLITTRYEDENEMPNYDLVEEDLEKYPEEMMNGQHSHQALPDLQDIEHDLPQQLSPMQPPKTPRLAPKSPAPQRIKSKKRPGEDKENRESNKRARTDTSTKYEKINHVERPSESYLNESSHPPLHDISSIQDVRAVNNSTAMAPIMDQPQFNNDSDNEEKEEDEDDIYDDYGGPMSIGPMEEMLPDETADQFEERMRTKRSNQLLKHMGTQLDEAGHINFTSLIRNNKRKVVAQKFYALLVLKKQMAIELYQNKDIPYSELTITKGHKYDEHMLANMGC